MKKLFLVLLISAMLLISVGLVTAKGMGKGWVYYAYIDVTWDGSSANGNWHVYDPDDNHLTGCDDCLEMEYDFVCIGNTLQFDETYVEVVPAYPQTHHVVLHDNDGDNVYTGWITARYDWPIGVTRMDVIEYEIEVNVNLFFILFEYG